MSEMRGAGPRIRPRRRKGAELLVLLCLLPALVAGFTPQPVPGARLRDAWRRPRPPLERSDVEVLRREVVGMFDHGFKGYMKHAFPQDNLHPGSCRGSQWQGGMAITLVDALDALVLLGRADDLDMAVYRLPFVLNFEDMDSEVHVFEVTIRALGGLLSGHLLLSRNPSIVPHYKGELLTLAETLGQRLMPAFATPSGLPASFINLKTGKPRDSDNTTCTACAGTLLMEFGLLSRLTGNTTYMSRARHAAETIFRRRSSLGLVGSMLTISSQPAWTAPEATIGPLGDSYYEYLLKAYLMFGDAVYLDMFTSLYTSTMAAMSLPRPVDAGFPGPLSFLVDVNMATGRLVRSWVSSLGAFWPGMQVLAGQDGDARALHSNFTAAWATHGLLPESFAFDLLRINKGDPGYNLRPEHIESAYLLHAETGDPVHVTTAAAVVESLRSTRSRCGFSGVANVETGVHTDLMESYFLSETLKYLALLLTDGAGALTDWFVLSTEGHVMPVLAGRDDDGSEERGVADEAADNNPQANSGAQGSGSGADGDCAGAAGSNECQSEGSGRKNASRFSGPSGQAVPANCQRVCMRPSPAELTASRRRLAASLPLVSVHGADVDARRLRRRRCRACIAVTEAMAARPPVSEPDRLARLNFGGAIGPGGREAKVLAQVVCQVAAVTESKKGVPHSSKGSGDLAGGNSSSNASSNATSTNSSTNSSSGTSSNSSTSTSSSSGGSVKVERKGRCSLVRPLEAGDALGGLTRESVVLQLSDAPPPPPAGATHPHEVPTAVVVSYEAEEGPRTLVIEAAGAGFGPAAPRVSSRCLERVANPVARVWAQPQHCPPQWPPQPVDWVSRCPTTERCEQLLASPAAQIVVTAPQKSKKVGKGQKEETAAEKAQQQQQQQQEHAVRSNIDGTRVVEAGSVVPPGHSVPSPLDTADALSCSGYNPCGSPGTGSWLPHAALNAPDTSEQPCGRARRLPAAPLSRPDPPDGCIPPRNRGAVSGSIAIVSRGGCSFIEKVAVLQAAGAVGVVVVNVMDDGGLLVMAHDYSSRSPSIPAVMITRRDGKRLLWWLARRPLLAALVSARGEAPVHPGDRTLGRRVSAVREKKRRGVGGHGGQEPVETQQQQQQSSEERKEDVEKQQQQQQQQHQQQQTEQQQQPKKQSTPPQGSRPPRGDDSTLRIDLLLPASTQAWLLEVVGHKGNLTAGAPAINDLLHWVMKDRVALRQLERMARRKVPRQTGAP